MVCWYASSVPLYVSSILIDVGSYAWRNVGCRSLSPPELITIGRAAGLVAKQHEKASASQDIARTALPTLPVSKSSTKPAPRHSSKTHSNLIP